MELKIFVIYIILINLLGFFLMFTDKKIAIRNGKEKCNVMRIPEEGLLIVAFIFGAIGSYIGMKVFHHKTKKWKFRLVVPFFILLNILFSYYIIKPLL